MRDTSSTCVRWARRSGYGWWLVCTFVGVAFCAGCTREVQPYAVRDLTRKGARPKAMVQAQRAAICPIVEVRDCRFKWSSKKLYVFYTDKPCEWMPAGQQVILVQQGDHFVETTREEGLPAIREIMQEYRLQRADFQNRERVHEFLQAIVRLRDETPGSLLASGLFLERVEREEGGIARWLRGREKSEAAFRELCYDPHIAWDNEGWAVPFTVLSPDGGVAYWTVVGDFDPRDGSCRITRIDWSPPDEKGLFSYPMSQDHEQVGDVR